MQTEPDTTDQSAVPRYRLIRRLRALSRADQAELITVIILSLAALASAWCGYQASQWNGEQASHFFRASSLRSEATHLRTLANLRVIADAGMLQDWEAAYLARNDQAMAFYWNRFSDELQAAADVWLALDPVNNPDAPASPLELPDYRISEFVRADDLDAEADRHAALGQEANDRSGEYVFTTVIFATVLLFAGIATKVSAQSARLLMIGLSVAFLIFGSLQFFLLPVSV